MEKCPRMLPKTERTDRQENRICITGVDESAHTIHARINGYKITAVCREKADPDIYDRIKDILLSSVVEKRS